MPRVSRKFQSDVAIIQQPSLHIYKVAVYVRLSIEDIRKKISDSIGTQKSMLLKYLQSQPGMQLYDIYEDLNYTGTNFNRPGFTRMIEDIQAGLVNCVVVRDLSRFGRNFEETGHYLERVFPFLRVRFIALGEKFDSLTATLDESTLMVPLMNLVNEVYARDISKKVTSGFKAKRERGEFCGSFAPYGYIKEGTHLIVDSEAAPVVQQIYQWRLEGMGIIAIVQKLNSLKILPPSRHRFEKGITKAKKHEETLYWYKSAVKRVLSNPAYVGNLALGRYKSNFLKGARVTVVAENEWVIVKDAHPAIISAETYDAVQKLTATRRNAYKWDNVTLTQNIFKGIIFCGDCGKHMARERRRAKFAYVCYVYRGVDPQSCTMKAIKEADLHAMLYAYIKREIDLAVEMPRIIAKVKKQQSYKHQQNIMDREIASLKRKLEQNRRFRGSLREDFKDGILTEQDYTTMKTDYDTEKDKFQLRMDELLTQKERHDEIISPENKWVLTFNRFHAEQQLSEDMVSSLIERIEIFDGGRIEVFLKYRSELDALHGYLTQFDSGAGDGSA